MPGKNASSLVFASLILLLVACAPSQETHLAEFSRLQTQLILAEEENARLLEQNLLLDENLTNQSQRLWEIARELEEAQVISQEIYTPKDISVHVQSPSDRIRESQIRVYDDRIIIDVHDAIWGTVSDTGSMEPVLGGESNTLHIIPKTEQDIRVGDIISYRLEGMTTNILHRVVFISTDEQGWYVVAKGDNNDVSDPQRIRFKQIKAVLVGVIY